MTHPSGTAPGARADLHIAVTGWGAVTAVAIVTLSIIALIFWVLASTPRTTNLTRIIKALHSADTHVTRTRDDIDAQPSEILTR